MPSFIACNVYVICVEFLLKKLYYKITLPSKIKNISAPKNKVVYPCEGQSADSNSAHATAR